MKKDFIEYLETLHANYQYQEVLLKGYSKKDIIPIRLLLIKSHIELKQYYKASQLIRGYEQDAYFLEQLIRVKMKTKKVATAITLINKNLDKEPVRIRKVIHLIKKRKFDEALKMTETMPNNDVAKSLAIKIHMFKEEYEKAINIGQDSLNNPAIRSQVINCLIYLKQLETARNLCKNYTQYNRISTALNYIEALLDKKEEYIDLETLNIFQKIKNNENIDINTLENYTELEIVTIKLALIKNNLMLDKKIKPAIKSLETEQNKKIINKLIQILDRKSKLLDIGEFLTIIEEIRKQPSVVIKEDKRIQYEN